MIFKHTGSEKNALHNLGIISLKEVLDGLEKLTLVDSRWLAVICGWRPIARGRWILIKSDFSFKGAPKIP
jgi:hypothetical protein